MAGISVTVGKVSAAVAGVAALAAAAFAVPAVTGGGGGTPTTFNLFIESGGGTCTRASTPVTFANIGSNGVDEVCGTLAQARTAASLGDDVGWRTGSYGAQTTSATSTTCTDTVNVYEDGGDVSVTADITLNGDCTWIDGIEVAQRSEIAGLSNGNKADGNVFWNTKLTGGIHIENANATGLYGQRTCLTTAVGCRSTAFACCQSGASQKVINFGGMLGSCAPCAATTHVSNTTIDGLDIFDSIRSSSGDHKECVFAIGVQGFTFVNNRSWNCAIYTISVGRIGDDLDPADVTICNNVMEPSDDITTGAEGGNSTIVLDHVDVRFDDLLICHNSLAQDIEINSADVPDSTGYDDTTIAYNIVDDQGDCNGDYTGTGPTWIGNVLDGANCGTGATMVANANALYTTTGTGGGTTGYSGMTWDFTLDDGAAAIDAASGSTMTDDILGNPRIGTPDAGAVEKG